MNKLGISIIIPCYNAGNFLIEAVDSILIQSFRYPFEIIIVDDGSTDEKTLLSLKEIENKNKVKIIKFSHNYGAQHARNTGLKLAIFDFILTIDSDDCLNVNTKVLENGTYTDRAIDILNTFPDVAFVHSMVEMFGEYSGLTMYSYPLNEFLVLEKYHVQTNIVYRKQDAFNAGLYNESIKKWQDWSFAIAILNSRFLLGKKMI